MQIRQILLIFGASAVAGQAQAASPSDLCRTFNRLLADVATTSSPASLSIASLRDSMGPACGPIHLTVDQDAFCAVAAAYVEKTHLIPWNLRDCLVQAGARVSFETGSGSTGIVKKPLMMRLSGQSRSGVQVKMTYAPDPADDFAGFYGEYKLRLEPPMR